MQKQDKLMVKNWVLTAERTARDLFDLSTKYHKDKELSRVLELLAGDLSYVNVDVLDTLARL